MTVYQSPARRFVFNTPHRVGGVNVKLGAPFSTRCMRQWRFVRRSWAAAASAYARQNSFIWPKSMRALSLARSLSRSHLLTSSLVVSENNKTTHAHLSYTNHAHIFVGSSSLHYTWGPHTPTPNNEPNYTSSDGTEGG